MTIISEHFYNKNRFICQKERIWFQNFKEELIITVLDQNQNKSMELESPNKTTNEFSNDNGKPKIIILFWNLVRKKNCFQRWNYQMLIKNIKINLWNWDFLMKQQVHLVLIMVKLTMIQGHFYIEIKSIKLKEFDFKTLKKKFDYSCFVWRTVNRWGRKSK